jgi:hypothetical protein
MTDLEAQVQNIHNAMVSVVQKSGYFKQVNDHEPTSPASGLDMFAACWLQLLRPIAARSGLNTVSGLLVYNVRMYTSQISDQQDYIDPQMIRATAKLMSSYSGAFTLGGLITAVDLLGLSGDIPLSGIAGYLQLGTTKYRVMTITVPMVVDDLFTQAA